MQDANAEVEDLLDSAEEPSRGSGSPEAEVRAISELGHLLTSLPPDARKRVLAWAIAFTGVDLADGRASVGTVRMPNGQDHDHPEDLSQLLEWAAPTKEVEYALLTCYFHTVVKGEESVDGATINSEMAQMGRRSSNITKTLSHLISKRPSLVILAGRSGRGTHSRKQYRVTSTGMAHVREMINANASGNRKH